VDHPVDDPVDSHPAQGITRLLVWKKLFITIKCVNSWQEVLAPLCGKR